MKLNVYIFIIISGFLCSCMAAPVGQQTRRQELTALKKEVHTPDRLSVDSVDNAKTPVIPMGTDKNAYPKKPGHAGNRTIRTFIVTGNSRMSTAKIQSQLQAYLGAHKTNMDVSNAMRSVIDLYSASGLNGAIITKDDDVVVLNVIEDGINAAAGTGSDSAGRHYALAITATPMLKQTIQPAPTAGFFVLKGNTRVSPVDIQQAIKPFAVKDFSPHAFFMARQAIIDLYEDRGLYGAAIGVPPRFDARPVVLTVYEDDIEGTAMAATDVDGKAMADAPSSWVRLGWLQIEHNHIDQALSVWQQGVNGMPPDRLLAYLGVYNQLSAALRRLKHIGINQSAIILKARVKGKSAYYVMSARDVPVDKTRRHQKLAGLRMAMGRHSRIYASSANKFQAASRLPPPY